MKQLFNIFSAIVFLTLIPNCSFSKCSRPTIRTVDHVDLNSYLGKWYEIRRIKNSFQDNKSKKGAGPCFNTTAEYSLLPKGKVAVKNTCFREGSSEVAQAKAHIVKGSNNSKLKVNFTGIGVLEWLGIGNGDYWILALGEKNSDDQYSWVLVGAPNLKFGWILSRTEIMNEEDAQKALGIAKSVGYDTTKFISFQK